MTETLPHELMANAVVELLGDGPLPIATVVERLDAGGYLAYLGEDGFADDELGAAAIEDLQTDAIWIRPDKSLVLTAHMTDGMILTHRLTADELENGAVEVTPDLVVLEWDTLGELHLGGDQYLRFRPGVRVPGEDHSTLSASDGWLAGFVDGDLIAFARTGGSVSVTRVDEDDVDDGDREIALLRTAAEKWIPTNESEEAVPIVMDALAADPLAFRRCVRPIGELLVAAGLERRGFSFGRRGEEWLSIGEKFARSYVDSAASKLVERWELDDCCQDALAVVSDAFQSMTTDGEAGLAIDAGAVAKALAHGAVVSAFAELVLSANDPDCDRLSAFAAVLLALGPNAHPAPARLLWALAADRRGEAVAAEAELRRTLVDEPGYGPAARWLAEFEIDRGEIRHALTLFRHPELRQSARTITQLETLRDLAEGPFRGVGRNDRCPCESGRKFKACCLREPKVSIEAQIALVRYKLARFAARTDNRAHLTRVASSVFDLADDDPMIEMLENMRDNPWIQDVAIFEGGIAQIYRASRAVLLPAGEHPVLEAMIDAPLRLWEVVDVQPGIGFTFRDVATSEVVQVIDGPRSADRQSGEQTLLRLARLPDGNRIVGVPLAVDADDRESLLAVLAEQPDADALAQWYGQTM